MGDMSKNCVTLVPITRPVGIPDRVPLSCRVGHMVRGVKYSHFAYPAFVFDRPTGGSNPSIGYPPGEVGNGYIELITTGNAPFDVSYGLDSRRPEAILALSILTPILYPPNVSYRIGIYHIYCIRYRPWGVFYGLGTYQTGYVAAH